MMKQIKIQLILKEKYKDEKLAKQFVKQFQKGTHAYTLKSVSEYGAVLNGSCELNELGQIKRELDSFMSWCQLTPEVDAEVILNVVSDDENQGLNNQSDKEVYFEQLIQCALMFFNSTQDITYLEEMYETCGIDEVESMIPILNESIEQIYDRVIFVKNAKVMHNDKKHGLSIHVPYMKQNKEQAYILTDGDIHVILVKGNNIYVLEEMNEDVKSLVENSKILTIHEENYLKDSFDANVFFVASTSYLLLELFCLYLEELKLSQGMLYS